MGVTKVLTLSKEALGEKGHRNKNKTCENEE